MQSSHLCPRCNSRNILEYDDLIECLDCNLTYTKEILEEIDDEYFLSLDDLGSFMDVFEEFKEEKNRRDFLKELDNDLS
ncbi:MAG: hypothetical protein ACFFA3_10830 [Promethearchaeota archaeon]